MAGGSCAAAHSHHDGIPDLAPTFVSQHDRSGLSPVSLPDYVRHCHASAMECQSGARGRDIIDDHELTSRLREPCIISKYHDSLKRETPKAFTAGDKAETL
jgi:hypothetical protein